MGFLKLSCFLVLLGLGQLSQALLYSKADYESEGGRSRESSRSKRNLLQFARMIKCATGRGWGAYNGYGCWCGYGGSGRPVDGTDRCCQIHDRCYDSVVASNVCPIGKIQVYTEIYRRVNCYGCSQRNDRCEQAICMCDSRAAQCFKRNRYQPRHANYDKARLCNSNSVC